MINFLQSCQPISVFVKDFFFRIKYTPYGLILCCLIGFNTTLNAQPLIRLPKAGLEEREIAIVYLKDNFESYQIAQYYQQRRRIPLENLVAIDLPADNHLVDPGVFAVQKKVIDAKLPEHIQAYALAWTDPFRVGCMGMTAAFALGYDVAYCAQGCKKTRRSAYHHTTSVRPYEDFGIRPAMMLAGKSLESVKALIDRGLLSDDTQPNARAILLKTSDKNRAVRQVYYPEFIKDYKDDFSIKVLNKDFVNDQDNILFYFTGTTYVKGLETLNFTPGAIADHLTSHGGTLKGSSQMSALEWLQAGATASYGTAREPCNFLEKFPDPTLVARYYLRGNTALESYWKSVAMPGQGNFIGEPLAKPFRGYRLSKRGADWVVSSKVFYPGYYQIYGGTLFNERLLDTRLLRKGENQIILQPPFAQSYRIERKRF